MSSIRRPQSNLPGNQNFSNGSASSSSTANNPNQRFYGPTLSQITAHGMLTLQAGIGQALCAGDGAPPMNPWEVDALAEIVKGLHVLSKARKKCGRGGWPQAQQGWNAAHQAEGVAEENFDEAGVNANANANQRQPAYAGR